MLFMPIVPPEEGKVAVGGVDKPRKVREEISLAPNCIVALHQLWKKTK
jgi:hypothetical protein